MTTVWRFAAAVLPLFVTGPAAAADHSARVSVGDLLRFAPIGDPSTLDWGGYVSGDRAGTMSPDGRYIAVVVGGGDPDAQTNNSMLIVYALQDLLKVPRPLTVVRFASAGPYQPIAFVRWLANSKELFVAGTTDAEVSQVYRVRVESGEIERITEFDHQLSYYDVAESGSRMVSLFPRRPVPPAARRTCQQVGCLVERLSLAEELRGGPTPDWNGQFFGRVHDLATGNSWPLVGPETRDHRVQACESGFSGGISPDGRFALRLCTLKAFDVPEWWAQYSIGAFGRACVGTRNAACWPVGYLVDLSTGEPARWSDAPLTHPYYGGNPIWIDGGRKLIIPAGYESLDRVAAAERGHLTTQYSALLLDTKTRRVARIGRLGKEVVRVNQAEWNEKSQTLVLQGQSEDGKSLKPVYFRRDRDRWHSIDGIAVSKEAKTPSISVRVEQSLNNPPKLVARDKITGLETIVFDPNPWMAAKHIGKVEAIEWISKTGQRLHGGLYLPPDHHAGQRYPLLIQTHGFDRRQFSLHGEARNFPGQALTARGIIVLQVDENDWKTYSTSEIWSNSRAVYESAIDHLDELGLIERTKVGVVGWSATGPTISAMLTHSDYPIAAAAFTATAVWGWWHNMVMDGIGFDARLGGSGAGSDLANWLERAPSFNFPRVRAPLLIYGGEGVLMKWDWYSGLRSLEKPVELWNLPTGTHDVYQASQRLKGNQLLVDWFSFWLKGEERHEVVSWGGETAQSLADQYIRWRELRRLHKADLQKPRPPLLKWTATPVPSSEEQRPAARP